MIKNKLKTFDIQNYLNTKEEVKEYFEAVLEEYEPDYLSIAIENIIKSKGYAEICKNNKLNDVFDKKAISYFNLFFKVIDNMGFKLSPKN